MNCFGKYCSILALLCLAWPLCAQYQIDGNIKCIKNIAINDVFLLLEPINKQTTTNAKGNYHFEGLDTGTYYLTFIAEGFHQLTEKIQITDQNIQKNIILKPLEVDIDEIKVEDEGYFLEPAVNGVTLIHGKTIGIISLAKTLANLSTNNPRQIYNKIPGLNIWENDNSGIQLNIGGRGLSPNRTSNFNTRQNGYDISADALGYPETYYTPPAQALEKIEVIRGAASLQFGTQFGGLLNFVLKEGPEDYQFEFTTENTYGAYNFANTFNSIGGTTAKGKLNYYGYYQYKRGDGWRPNADFEAHNAYAQLTYKPSKKLSIKAEQTIMRYVAHQPGGLTDIEFEQEARQSKRDRNWFRVNWNLSALTLNYKFNSYTQLNIRNFALFASRQSLGNLQAINRPDYGGPRDLIKGHYMNFGNETRLLHRYTLFKGVSTFVAGVRVYKGHTQQQQGYSNGGETGKWSDFNLNQPTDGILVSDYTFPSFNFAAFAENYFAITKKFGITPGVRLEYIQTAADGYYQDLLVVPSTMEWDTLKNEAVGEFRKSKRTVFLGGIGMSYKFTPNLELYTNFSQNYRAINFNDMRISNPNQEVDPNLKDEYGYNIDLGIKGSYKGLFNFKATLFYLGYNRRIGNIQSERPNSQNPLIIEPYTLRTNVGNARVLGIETYLDADLWKLISKNQKSPFSLGVFANISYLDGRYLKSANSYAAGKQLELVAPFILRTGIHFGYKSFQIAYQYSYTAKHYSDATNAEWVPNAVVGVIPAYGVMDLSATYEWKWFRLQAGINNLANAKYFTRRATSYPGPGILPADGISYYITLRFKIGVK